MTRTPSWKDDMHTYTNQIQTGTTVYGSDNEKIGDVASVGEDYFVIEKGFILKTDMYVPMSAVAGVDDDGIRLTMTKDQVEDEDWSEAPEAGGHASYATDDAYRSEATATTPEAYGSTGEDDRIERREERLTVDKTAEQTGSVHVGKHVEEDRQAVDVPVEREEVTLERHAADRPATGELRSDDSIDVPVYEGRVETDKEARVVEELEVGKRTVADTEHVEETVRREEFDIEETGSGTRRDRE